MAALAREAEASAETGRGDGVRYFVKRCHFRGGPGRQTQMFSGDSPGRLRLIAPGGGARAGAPRSAVKEGRFWCFWATASGGSDVLPETAWAPRSVATEGWLCPESPLPTERVGGRVADAEQKKMTLRTFSPPLAFGKVSVGVSARVSTKVSAKVSKRSLRPSLQTESPAEVSRRSLQPQSPSTSPSTSLQLSPSASRLHRGP